MASNAQEAKDILQKAYKAAHQVNSASYNMVYKYKPPTSDTPAIIKNNVILKRDNSIRLAFAKVRYTNDYGLVTYNGKQYKLLNDKSRKLFVVDSINGALGRIVGNWIGASFRNILTNDTSALTFEDGAVFKLEKSKLKLDKVDCYRIVATYSANTARKVMPDLSEMREEYFIGKKDLVLRKYKESLVYNDKTTEFTEFTITGLKLNGEYPDSIFDQSKPEGYALDVYKPKPKQELLKSGADAPDFTLKNARGEDVSLKDYRGNYLVIDFWGTWCVWCKRAMPNIQKVYEQMKDKGVNVVGISCREPDRADPAKFMSQNNYTYGLLLKGDKVAEAFNVTGYPTLYIINKEGRIIYSEAGFEEGMDQKLIDVIEKDMKN